MEGLGEGICELFPKVEGMGVFISPIRICRVHFVDLGE